MKRIQETIQFRSTFLLLPFTSLGRFPTEVLDMPWLRDLDLAVNQISSIPPEIGKLVHLRSLKLSGNNITELPAEIGRLRSLRFLYINRNPISELPAEIGQLTSLRSLHLIDTNINQLPPELADTNLERIFLRGCPLPAVYRNLITPESTETARRILAFLRGQEPSEEPQQGNDEDEPDPPELDQMFA